MILQFFDKNISDFQRYISCILKGTLFDFFV